MNEPMSPREKKSLLIAAVIVGLLVAAGVVAWVLTPSTAPDVSPGAVEESQWSKISGLPKEAGVFEGTFELSDGREVTCIVLDASKRAGVSCDWESAQAK